MLHVGDVAPRFVLPDADMDEIDVGQCLAESHVVLFFYPRDNTPVCTMEAVGFGDHIEAFQEAGAGVFGISRDDCLSHACFRDRHGLDVTLLADTDGRVCRRYGVLQKREVDGVVREGIVRTTFVIEKGGKIRHIVGDEVPGKAHAAEVLDLLKTL